MLPRPEIVEFYARRADDDLRNVFHNAGTTPDLYPSEELMAAYVVSASRGLVGLENLEKVHELLETAYGPGAPLEALKDAGIQNALSENWQAPTSNSFFDEGALQQLPPDHPMVKALAARRSLATAATATAARPGALTAPSPSSSQSASAEVAEADEVLSANSPKLFPQWSIYVFALFASHFVAAFLLLANLIILKRDRGGWQVLLFTLSLTMLQIVVYQLGYGGLELAFWFNLFGASLLVNVFWRLYIGERLKFRSRSILIPVALLIGVMSLVYFTWPDLREAVDASVNARMAQMEGASKAD
jgi:hypothetical protein